MADQSTEGADGQSELDSMTKRLAELKRQNEMLGLETEIYYLERAIAEVSQHLPYETSTPMPTKSGPPIEPRILLSYIPKGRPEKTDQTLSDKTDKRPDRFVTVRKKQPSPDLKPNGVVMKPATFDGTVAWLDYKAHFDACAELNGWSDEQKGLYLSVSLRGQAQGVFGNLGTGKHDYKELVTALKERFAPPNQTELYRVQLRESRQKASETMSELGQDVRRLTNLAYPKAPADVRETLAKEQFVDALINSEMKLKIKQARPVDLNDAVRHAVELEAFYRAERQGLVHATTLSEQKDETGWKEALSAMNKTMEEMTKAMSKLTEQQRRAQTSTRGQTLNRRYDGNRPSYNNQNRHTKTCHICKSEMHLMKDCPHRNERSHPQSDETDKCQKGGSHQAGLFVQAEIGQYDVNCLVDTGATLTLLSTKVWDMVKDIGTLKKYDRKILSFSGNRLTTKGKTRVCLNIKGTSCVVDAVIAEIDVDAIIGLDFMLAHDVVVDVVNMKLSIKGVECPLVKAGRIGCNKIVTVDRNSVRSRSDAILDGKVLDRDQNTEDDGTWKSPEAALKATCIVLETTADCSSINVASVMKDQSQTIETRSHRKKKRSKRIIECLTCGRAFKKRSYLSKHKFAQHKADASNKRVLSSTNEVVGLELEHSTSANEPDVTIGEGEPKVEVKRSPRKMSLVAGRIVRKATKPITPLAPKKRKAEATAGSDSQTPKRMKAEATPSLVPDPAADRKVMQSKSGEKVEKKKNDVVVRCKRGSAEQTIEVEEDGEVMYRNSVINRRKQNDSMVVSVEDLIPEGNIKSSDVKVCVQEGQIVLSFSYVPDK